MSVSTLTLVRCLRDTADLLEIGGADVVRVRAFQRAAEALLSLPQGLPEFLAAGHRLRELPCISPDLAVAIRQLLAQEGGSLLAEGPDTPPAGLLALRHVSGLGVKRITALWRGLGITGPEELLAATRARRVQRLEGFGPKLEENLTLATCQYLDGRRDVFLAEAEEFAAPLLDRLADAGAPAPLLVGSGRRRAEAVDSLDYLLPGSAVPDIALPECARLLAREPGYLGLLLRNGLRLSIQAAAPETLGAALLLSTGSSLHLEALRHLAAQRGLELTPQGLMRGPARLPSDTEEAVYTALGLPWIPPELREGCGEVEAALEGRLPRLLDLPDVRGDLHTHSTFSDGKHSLEDMAQAAMHRGYAYLGVADHSAIPGMRLGMSPADVLAQGEAIDVLNARLAGRLTLLKGCEVEIYPDGELGLPPEILSRLDYALCAVHTTFDQPRAAQTARMLRAMNHPACSILGHPSGRAVGMFPAMDLDMERIIALAAERGIILELDAKRDRMDMSAEQCRQARAAGVDISISTDSHNVGGLAAMPYGVGIARRAWLEKGDVVNCLPLEALKTRLKARR